MHSIRFYFLLIFFGPVANGLTLECRTDILRSVQLTKQNYMTVTSYGEFPERVEGRATLSTLLGLGAKKYHLSSTPTDFYHLTVGDLGEEARLEWRGSSTLCKITSQK